MFDVNKAIYACDDVICRNIESFTTEQRGLFSQNEDCRRESEL